MPSTVIIPSLRHFQYANMVDHETAKADATKSDLNVGSVARPHRRPRVLTKRSAPGTLCQRLNVGCHYQEQSVQKYVHALNHSLWTL